MQFAKICLNGEQTDLPEVAGDIIFELCDQLLFLHEKIAHCFRKMNAIAKSEKRVALLQTIPGIGPITASTIVATIGSGKQFNNGRELSAWLGLTPLNKSSGGKERLGRKPSKVAAIAMANKTARIVWAVLIRDEPYKVRTT